MADEKDEKFDEKEMEKKEEKSPQEKNWDEKFRRDPLGALVWPAILIWAGLVLLASNLGLLTFRRIPGLPEAFHPDAWGFIMLGAGVIILIEVVIRLLVPEYRKPVFGSIVLAAIFIGIGLGNLTNWDVVWPLILIALGLSIVFRGFTRGRRSKGEGGGEQGPGSGQV